MRQPVQPPKDPNHDKDNQKIPDNNQFKPSQGFMIRFHIFSDSLMCVAGFITLYASVMSAAWLSCLIFMLLISCVGYYKQDILFLEQFFDPKDKEQQNIQPCFHGSNELYQLIGWILLSIPAMFFNRYPAIVCFLLVIPFFSISQVVWIAFIVSMCDVFKALLNSALVIDGLSRSKQDNPYRWIISHQTRYILKQLSFWFCGSIISIYESMPSLISIWVPVFLIPMPSWFMLICGISFGICNLLLQDSYNLLSPTDDQTSYQYHPHLKHFIAGFLCCSWFGRVFLKISYSYVVLNFFTLFLPQGVALIVTTTHIIVAILTTGNYEYTKYQQTFNIIDEKYFNDQSHRSSTSQFESTKPMSIEIHSEQALGQQVDHDSEGSQSNVVYNK